MKKGRLTATFKLGCGDIRNSEPSPDSDRGSNPSIWRQTTPQGPSQQPHSSKRMILISLRTDKTAILADVVFESTMAIAQSVKILLIKNICF